MWNMRILNIEDSIYKHVNICKVLSDVSEHNVERATNLQEAVEMISSSIDSQEPYDLLITDMWYPETKGGKDAQSGDVLIELVKKNNWGIPIILCSSVNYYYSDILGNIHYSDNENWEEKLREMIKEAKSSVLGRAKPC